MTNRWLDRAKSAQTRLRERRTPLTDDLALVEDPGAAPARVSELDETTWLVERGERRRVVPYALGREDGEAEIHVNDTLSSMLDASEFGVEWKESMGRAPTTTIQVRRLDGVLAEVLDGVTGADGAAPRLYLKLDTQGFDLEAFAGLGDRVSDVLGMQSEVACLPIYDGMPGMSEALETYTAAGFSLTAMFPVSRHVPTMRVIEFDAFLVRDPDPEHPDRHP